MANDAAVPRTDEAADTTELAAAPELGALLETPVGSGSEDATVGLRAIFADIGNEETTARLESRLDAIEDELERSDRRLHDHERARRGELDVMRARVEDVLAAVEAALTDTRHAQLESEARLVELVEQVRAEQEQRVAALRDEVAPAVTRLLRVTEGITGRLKAVGDELGQTSSEVGSLGAELDTFRDDVTTRTARLRSELGEQLDAANRELGERLDKVTGDVNARLTKLHGEVHDRLDSTDDNLKAAVGEAVADVRSEADQRDASLRSELGGQLRELRELVESGVGERDRALGDLRADFAEQRGELALRLDEVHRLAKETAGTVPEQVERAVADQQRQIDEALSSQRNAVEQAAVAQRAELDQAAAALQQQVAEVSGEARRAVEALEKRWVSDTMDLGRGMESAMGRAEERVLKERADRTAAMDRLVERIDQLTGRLDRLEDGVTPPSERLGPSTESLRLDLDEMAARVSALQAQVANAIGSMATELSSRVSRVQGELAALRDQVTDAT